MSKQPTRIEPISAFELLLEWNSGEKFRVPFREMRFYCPCAGCVNEITGQRMIQKSNIKPDVAPKNVELIGRYALKFFWNDGHSTGMYPFDTLYTICKTAGDLITGSQPDAQT